MLKKEEKIKVILVKPMRKPVVVEIENTLEAMQKVVGGYIETPYFFDDNMIIITNEEGPHLNLPHNRAIVDEDGEIIDVIAGDFIIAYAPPESEDFCSVPDELVDKYFKKFE